MAETVCIDYQLGKNGWSRFQLSVGTASVVIGPFGYCTDALGDLVRAALMIATTGLRAEVRFDAYARGRQLRWAYREVHAPRRDTQIRFSSGIPAVWSSQDSVDTG